MDLRKKVNDTANKILSKLNESEKVGVVVNPNHSGLIKLFSESEYKQLRFLVDKKSNMAFVSKGNITLHSEIAKISGVDLRDCVQGLLVLRDGSIKIKYIIDFNKRKEEWGTPNQKIINHTEKIFGAEVDNKMDESSECESYSEILVNPSLKQIRKLLGCSKRVGAEHKDVKQGIRWVATVKGNKKEFAIGNAMFVLHDSVSSYLNWEPRQKRANGIAVFDRGYNLIDFEVTLGVRSEEEDWGKDWSWVRDKLSGSMEESTDRINDEDEPDKYEYREKEIVVNPTKKEALKALDKIYNEIRFVVTTKPKRIYTTDAYTTLHYLIARKIGVSQRDCIFGIAKVINDKIIINDLRTFDLVTGRMDKRLNKKDYPWIEEALNDKFKLDENLELIKFNYDNYHHDPSPNVKVLDFMYPGKPGQKTFGKRRDVLGWNINYFKNRKYAEQSVDEIDSFARLLDANDKEKYERVKDFFPEQAKLIRRYKKKHIKNLRVYKDGRWKRTTYNDLIKFDRDNV
jgi:hypothetical protein